MNEMTTRGTNPSSISPPVQIPQPRHVSTISSGTPPPNQQIFPGQSPGLVQGPTYNFIQPQYQQGEQFLPYQAYGSAPNDLRGTPSNTGRGGTGPANMAQSGAYYHQANQNMRPSQPPPPNQPYYLNQTGQNNMRHPRPSNSAPNPHMVFIQPNPNNMVISANMYQQTPRMPLYSQGGPQYQTRYAQPGGMMYFNGGVQRPSVSMQTQGMGPPPAPREKRFIKISDPNTGRNITDEIIKSSHQAPTDERSEPEDTSANDKGVEIRKNFTRQVVERMKIGEASALPAQPSVEPASPSPQPGGLSQPNQPSQEHAQLPSSYPPGHPQQPQSTPPLTGAGLGPMLPPPMRMGAVQMDMSVPPPSLPHNMVYNNRHGTPQQSIPSQAPVQTQHVLQPKGPPPSSVAIADTAPPARLESNTHPSAEDTPSTAERKTSTSHIEAVIPKSDIPTTADLATTDTDAKNSVQGWEGKTVQEPTSQPSSQTYSSEDTKMSSSPAQSVTVSESNVETVPVHQTQQSPPASDPAPQPVVASTSSSTSSDTKQLKPDAASEADNSVKETAATAKAADAPKKAVTDEVVSQGKDENGAGASTQGSKDGRKGKKNKKDFSRKESGGSDMDAFIDTSNVTTNNGSARLAVSDSTSETISHQSEESLTPKQVINSETISTSIQMESKNKVKKKKKKKGKKAAATSSIAKVDDPEDTSEKNACAPSNLKDCENNAEDLSPGESNSHSSEGKDSGVDSESGQTVQDQGALSESKAQIPTVSRQTDVDLPEVKKDKQPSPVPIPSTHVDAPVEKTPVEEPSPEKDATVVNPDTVKIQNGTEPADDKLQTEKQASVPNDSPSVPEVILADEADDVQMNNEHLPEENGTPKIEDVEPSKAEVYAKLKKSGGKLVYDRAYLMELRECASSQAKPDGLPALEIILDQPSPFMSRPSMGPADFTPAFFQTGVNQRHAPPIGKSSSRGRQRPGDMPATPRVIKSISMSNEAKLHQSENPWKPTKKEDKDEQKSLEGEILFIMNRLTPTNFEKMANEMKNLNVKTYEDLQYMVKTFFDKVTLETKFVEAYAQLCKVMSGLKVTPPTDGSVKDNMATFRVVMLTKCQQEFEADKSIIFEKPEDKRKKLEAENPEKTPARQELIENTLYQMKLKRMKFYGNIRFIGELFKLGMLTESIMHDCIYRLLKARDDDSLVSLCNLLTTVGRNLDTDKAKPRMEQYFSQMTKIADERKSRIKFTLRDVLELRQSNWIPRKQATGPKKIDEVHKDFAQEQMRNQYLASQPAPPPRNDNSQAGSRRGSRQRPDENKMGEDGWNTVGNPKAFRIDASKMKISSKSMVDDNIQLGPGGGAHKPIWSRGSHGGTQQQPPQDDRPALGNRFSALTSEDARRAFPRSPSRGEGSAGRGLRQGQTAGHGRGKILTRSSQEGERRDAIANARSFMGGRSQNSSRDNSWNRDDGRQFMGPRSSWDRDNAMTRSDSAVRTEEFKTPAPPSVKQMSEHEIETKAVNILDEYLNIRDLTEAKLCMKELIGQNHLHLVVTASINNVLEKRDDDRRMTGSLFNELVKQNTISVSTFIKGLNEVLEFASDMVVDIPTLWNCLAQAISPLLVGGTVPWSKLKQAFTPHLDNKDGAKLMAALLSQSVEKLGEKEISQEWQNSGLSWSTYLKADELNAFVADKKLSFTLGASSGGAALLPDLEKMIRNRASNNELLSYIEKTVPGGKKDSSFIRSLTTAVVSSSINESKSINEDVIKSNKDVLQRYLGNAVDLQLQALYAIQSLMVKLEHPSGVLAKLLELLYDEMSVEEEAFYRWEKCNDPQEQEGKGTCLMQVRQFFVWLRENEEPDTES